MGISPTAMIPERPPTFSGRTASQNAEELLAFIQLLRDEQVMAYGEIGAREGDTFHDVMLALPKGAKGVALDFPGGAWGAHGTDRQLLKCMADLKAHGRNVSHLLGDSKSAQIIGAFHGRGPYDAILIDGDHRLPGVTADWKHYQDVAPLVAFHDIVGKGQLDRNNHPVEVYMLWESIKASGLRTQEFVAPGSKMGIGVVWTAAWKLAA